MVALLTVFVVLLCGAASAFAEVLCPPARYALSPLWSQLQDFRYAPSLVPPSGMAVDGAHLLALYSSDLVLDAQVVVKGGPLGAACALCVSQIRGTLGFTPGRVEVLERLRGHRCHVRHALAHELLHGAVVSDEERHAHRLARRALGPWLGRHRPVPVPCAGVGGASSELSRQVLARLHSLVSVVDASASVRHGEIDSPSRRLFESRRMYRECGPLPP